MADEIPTANEQPTAQCSQHPDAIEALWARHINGKVPFSYQTVMKFRRHLSKMENTARAILERSGFSNIFYMTQMSNITDDNEAGLLLRFEVMMEKTFEQICRQARAAEKKNQEHGPSTATLNPEWKALTKEIKSTLKPLIKSLDGKTAAQARQVNDYLLYQIESGDERIPKALAEDLFEFLQNVDFTQTLRAVFALAVLAKGPSNPGGKPPKSPAKPFVTEAAMFWQWATEKETIDRKFKSGPSFARFCVDVAEHFYVPVTDTQIESAIRGLDRTMKKSTPPPVLTDEEKWALALLRDVRPGFLARPGPKIIRRTNNWQD